MTLSRVLGVLLLAVTLAAVVWLMIRVYGWPQALGPLLGAPAFGLLVWVGLSLALPARPGPDDVKGTLGVVPPPAPVQTRRAGSDPRAVQARRAVIETGKRSAIIAHEREQQAKRSRR